MTQNSLYAWYLACRPKTLSGALVSVFCACALAMNHLHSLPLVEGAEDGSFDWKAAGLCALFASLMQILSNLVNDLYDFLHGADGEERLGPERACAQGWITPRAMRIGIAVVSLLAATVGLQLMTYVEAWMVIPVVGIVLIGAFFYTLFGSYHGLGDLLVYAFFGYVPTCGTYLVLTEGKLGHGMEVLGWEVWLLATAVALVVDTLLVVNNYRDRVGDAQAGKKTLIVRLGAHFGERFYLWQGLLAWLLVMLLGLHGHHMFLVTLYALLHSKTAREMRLLKEGRALNAILGKTSLGMMLFAALTTLSLLF